MTDPLTLINTRRTVQTEQADPRQVRNSAGGFVFEVDDMARLRRFLVTGVTGGTFYVGERELAKDNAGVVLRLAQERGVDVVDEVLTISLGGRAVKQEPALFALAVVIAKGTPEAQAAAEAALPRVARTGTHLMIFNEYVQQFRGWGPLLCRAVGRWYTEKSADDLAYQVTKYRNRKGWTHRDVLRSAHPRPGGLSKRELQIVARLGESGATPLPDLAVGIGVDEANTTRLVDRLSERGHIRNDDGAFRIAEAGREVLAQRTVFDFATGRYREGTPGAPQLLDVFLAAQRSPNARATAGLVREHRALAWEMLPNDHLNDPGVWEALLEQGMPMTALLRNLPRLTRLGLLPQGHARTHAVVQQLTDVDRLRKARVHPMTVLIALRTYAEGVSMRGDSTWAPTPQVTDGLDRAFYAAFGTVEPTGKRILLAVDVSGSMRTNTVAGIPMSAREAAAAMAMVTVATEPYVDVVGFTGTLPGGQYSGGFWSLNTVATASEALTPLDLSPRRRLDDIMTYMDGLPFGGTDCALPWSMALEQSREYDAVITLSDNETWAGPVHVHQAQRLYRERMGIPTRSIAAALTATSYTVNDPQDALSLDIAGLDSNVPKLISDFVAGQI